MVPATIAVWAAARTRSLEKSSPAKLFRTQFMFAGTGMMNCNPGCLRRSLIGLDVSNRSPDAAVGQIFYSLDVAHVAGH